MNSCKVFSARDAKNFLGRTAALIFVLQVSALALAQDQAKVEVTGSSIKRIADEGALPVISVTRQEIVNSGATSIVELIQRLPAIQGGTVEADSIGGGGGGLATVSLHNLTEDRTLVLLNGRRILGGFRNAPDLNMLPISIIERVEILTDGASAIYGSDAIGGVVNFVTRRDLNDGSVILSTSRPQQSGGAEKNISLTKGWGSLSADGYNVIASISVDRRDSLNALQRDFSKTGVINFPYEGSTYQFFNGSPRTIPGNVNVPGVGLKNPYLVANGKCPPQHVNDSGTCYFDYASTVQAYPERERTNFFGSFSNKVGSDGLFTLTTIVGNTKTDGKIAPVPGGLSVSPTGPFASYLTSLGYAASSNATVYYRAFDLGNRRSIFDRDFKGVWASFDSVVNGWDYNATVGFQDTKMMESNTGYPYGQAFNELMASGLFNPFVPVGNQSRAALDAAAGIMVNGPYNETKTQLLTFDGKISKELAKFDWTAAPINLAFGLSRFQERGSQSPSLAAQGKGGPSGDDSRFGDAGELVPYSVKRSFTGIFSEVLTPLRKDLEVGTAIRFDQYESSFSKSTAKVNFRYMPQKIVLVRGSIGSGFRAPTSDMTGKPDEYFGVTARPYDCNAQMLAIASTLGAICQPPGTQYDTYLGKNADLKPEKSNQASLGLRLEPSKDFSIGVDWWWVRVSDRFYIVAEDRAFENPDKYANLWRTYTDPVTGDKYLAYLKKYSNSGNEFVSGLDLESSLRQSTPVGLLRSTLRMTYMLRDVFQTESGGAYFSTVGDHNPEIGSVTFKWRGQLQNVLQTGSWTNVLNVNFQSGYKDYPADVYKIDSSGNYIDGSDKSVRLRVKSFVTFDLSSAYKVSKSVFFKLGVMNLLDKEPPLSLRTSGAHMLGYDYRYFSPLGRTFILSSNISF